MESSFVKDTVILFQFFRTSCSIAATGSTGAAAVRSLPLRAIRRGIFPATPGHTPGHISIRALDGEYMVTGDAAVLEGGALTIANPEFCLDMEAAKNSLAEMTRRECRRYICYHGGVLER